MSIIDILLHIAAAVLGYVIGQTNHYVTVIFRLIKCHFQFIVMIAYFTFFTPLLL